jgi:hypothetical protein
MICFRNISVNTLHKGDDFNDDDDDDDDDDDKASSQNEAVVVSFQWQSWHFLGVTEVNHDSPQSTHNRHFLDSQTLRFSSVKDVKGLPTQFCPPDKRTLLIPREHCMLGVKPVAAPLFTPRALSWERT